MTPFWAQTPNSAPLPLEPMKLHQTDWSHTEGLSQALILLAKCVGLVASRSTECCSQVSSFGWIAFLQNRYRNANQSHLQCESGVVRHCNVEKGQEHCAPSSMSVQSQASEHHFLNLNRFGPLRNAYSYILHTFTWSYAILVTVMDTAPFKIQLHKLHHCSIPNPSLKLAHCALKLHQKLVQRS